MHKLSYNMQSKYVPMITLHVSKYAKYVATKYVAFYKVCRAKYVPPLQSMSGHTLRNMK